MHFGVLTSISIFEYLNIELKYKPFTSFNTTCKQTIDNCLYVFYYSTSFEDAIRKTLLMGGDTDTNCAIVGSMAEALYNIDKELISKVNEKLPEEFIKLLVKAKY